VFCARVRAQCRHQGLALSRSLFPDGEVLDSGSLIVALVHFGTLDDVGDVWNSFPADSLADLTMPSSSK
jgi:hypothetical protein